MITYTPKIDTNTVALYQFKDRLTDDSGNGHTLIDNGTTPLGVVPSSTVSNWNAGVFTDANYLIGSAGLQTALSGQTEFLFECYVYFNSLANQPVITYHTQNGLAWWIQGLSDTSIKMQWGGSIAASATSVISTGTWYYVAGYMFSGSGTSKLWCSPADNISQSTVATLNYNTSLGNNTSIGIGRYVPAGSFALNGYMKNARYSTYSPSTVPTVDPRPQVN